jgi:hypothetical protein
VNLVRGLRFVRVSVLVLATQFLGPARALPVRFEPAPPAIKPKSQNCAHQHTRRNSKKQHKTADKTAAPAGKQKAAILSPEEKEYRLQKKLRALTQGGVRVLPSLRQALDARPETRPRQLLVGGDGSYTNRTNWT